MFTKEPNSNKTKPNPSMNLLHSIHKCGIPKLFLIKNTSMQNDEKDLLFINFNKISGQIFACFVLILYLLDRKPGSFECVRQYATYKKILLCMHLLLFWTYFYQQLFCGTALDLCPLFAVDISSSHRRCCVHTGNKVFFVSSDSNQNLKKILLNGKVH